MNSNKFKQKQSWRLSKECFENQTGNFVYIRVKPFKNLFELLFRKIFRFSFALLRTYCLVVDFIWKPWNRKKKKIPPVVKSLQASHILFKNHQSHFLWDDELYIQRTKHFLCLFSVHAHKISSWVFVTYSQESFRNLKTKQKSQRIQKFI